MGFWDAFVQAGQSATQAVADRRPARRRQRGPECTPCAAQAYVESLRGTPPKKQKPKRR